MAVAAAKLVQARRIRLERQFGNFITALRALPVTLIHLALETSTAIVIKSHFAFILFFLINDLTDSKAKRLLTA